MLWVSLKYGLYNRGRLAPVRLDESILNQSSHNSMRNSKQKQYCHSHCVHTYVHTTTATVLCECVLAKNSIPTVTSLCNSTMQFVFVLLLGRHYQAPCSLLKATGWTTSQWDILHWQFSRMLNHTPLLTTVTHKAMYTCESLNRKSNIGLDTYKYKYIP